MDIYHIIAYILIFIQWMILYDIIVDLYLLSQYLYIRCEFDMVQPYISIFIYVVQFNHIIRSYNCIYFDIYTEKDRLLTSLHCT